MIRNLKAVAEDILNKSLADQPWRPTAKEIADHYDLKDDHQTRKVKAYVKKAAGELGVCWGYNPEIRRYQTAPDNAPEVARTIIDSACRHWSDAAGSIHWQITGAAGQGFITSHDRDRALDNLSDLRARINTVYEATRLTDIPNPRPSTELASK